MIYLIYVYKQIINATGNASEHDVNTPPTHPFPNKRTSELVTRDQGIINVTSKVTQVNMTFPPPSPTRERQS